MGDLQVGDVYYVYMWHLGRNRKMMVKVLHNDGCALGHKVMIVGGMTTKLLHHGLTKCVYPEQFKEENKLPHLRDTVFDF